MDVRVTGERKNGILGTRKIREGIGERDSGGYY
jgi:hypothetical protein